MSGGSVLVAGLVVRVAPGADVEPALERLAGVDVVGATAAGVALVTEARSARDQEALHDRVRAVPGVIDVAVAGVVGGVA